MGTFAPQSVYSNTPSPQTGAGLAALASNLEAVKELPGAQPPQNIEISDNALTFTVGAGGVAAVSAFLVVDTEGQAAADDLEVINPVVSATDNLHDGMLLYLQAADAGRVVTVKNSSSANGIRTAGGGDITLATDAWLVLQLRSGTWYELAVQPSGILPIANGGTGSSTKNFVDLSSAQTVAGVKTLTANPVVKAATPVLTLQQTDITKGTNPSADQFAYLSIVDSAGTATANRTGVIENRIKDSGLVSTWLRAYQFVNGSTVNAALGVHCSADGNTKYAVAPTPAAGDNSDKIATTEWVNANVPSLASAMLYNTRTVLTTSGTWTAPVTGWYKITCIGGGGGGGNGTTYGGAQGGTTTFANLSSIGGSGGGCGSAACSSGGGGGASTPVIDYMYLTKGQVISVAVGSGGVGGGSGSIHGTGPQGGKGQTFSGTASWGAPGQGGGNGASGTPAAYSSFDGYGGNGGSNGTGYGGGGGGGKNTYNNGNNGGYFGLGNDGGQNGTMALNAGRGGNGGSGAIIIEYFDPSKAA